MDNLSARPSKRGRKHLNRKALTIQIDLDVLALLDAVPYGGRSENLNRILRDALSREALPRQTA